MSVPTANTDVTSRQHTAWLPRPVALALALYALIGGTCSFLGWMLDIRRLTDWNNSGISIQPNAALCVALSGLSLLLLVSQRRRAAAAFSAMVMLLGGATLLEWLTGATLGIDSLFLFGREWGRVGVVWPGRMGPPGSLSWTLIGASLLLSASSARWRRLAPLLAILTLALSLISLTAHLYGASILYTMPRLTIIALQTATFIAAVSIGLIACHPDRQPMYLLLHRGTAGILARRLLPLLIAVPFGLGMLRVLGQEAGFFDTAFGTTLRTVIEIVFLLGLLWWSLSIVHRHEEFQRESVDRTNAVLGSITDAFFTLDPDWRFAFVNDEIVRRFGLPREQIVGSNIWEMFPESEDNEPRIHLDRAMRDRVSVEYDFHYAPWQRWFHHKVYPAADGGLAVYSQDITERKNAETALRRGQDELDRQRRLYEAILGNTPDLAYVFDLNHRFTYANEVLLKMWGKTWDEAIGKNCLELGYEPWHAEMHDREIRQVIATRQPIRGEVPFSGAFGRRIYDYIFVPVLNADGEVEAIAGTTRDVTERQEAERALAEHASIAENALAQRTRELIDTYESLRRTEAMATLGALAGGMTHDLTNLLLPLETRVQLLQDGDPQGPPPPGWREHVDAIAKSVEYLRILGQRMRQYQRDAGRDHASPRHGKAEPVDLAHWCREVEPFLRGVLPAREREGRVMAFECHIPAGLPMLPLNKTGLTQAVYNLVQNAVKALRKSGVGHKIDVFAWVHEHRLEEGRTDVCIGVFDDGPGMAAEVLARCTEPRFTTDGESGGTGMGLSLVKAFVDQSGGELGIYSPPPAVAGRPASARGVAVVMRFPVRAPSRTHSPLQATAPAASLSTQ